MQYVIYKITCNNQDVDHVYVGSTKRFEIRQYMHMMRSKDEKCTLKLYMMIRKHEGFDNWKIEAVETSTCKTNFERRARDRFWFDELRADINLIRPQVSRMEAKEKQNQPAEKNLVSAMGKRRQYYEKNKVILNVKHRQYYEENKDRLMEYSKKHCSQKIHCDACDTYRRKGDISKHNKTKLHLNNLQMKNSE